MAAVGGDHSPIIFLFVIAGLIAFAAFGPRTVRAAAVPDGPEDEPYRIYTTDYDLELRGAEVVEALSDASLDRKRGFLHRNPSTWKAWIVRTNDLLKRNDGLFEESLPGLRAAMTGLDPRQVAVALLIDQSGSMKGEPVARAAATADFVARLLAGLGVCSEVLGFSTAGWHGGRAREAWHRAGRPERPGRLCALMHVVYKSAAEPALTEVSRNAIVHPDLLRENVDGEAVLWARDRLAALSVRHRLLLDATLTQNGPSILHRHIIKVVRDLEADGLIIGGVGINHRVEAYYPRSEAVTALDDLPEAVARVLTRMLAAAAEKAGFPRPQA
jgi:cobaltochelatase CobT